MISQNKHVLYDFTVNMIAKKTVQINSMCYMEFSLNCSKELYHDSSTSHPNYVHVSCFLIMF